MAIPVEGVKSHAVKVKTEEYGYNIAPTDAMDVRHKALVLALSGNHANLNADRIVERAKAFETYMITGSLQETQHIPTVQEQIVSAMANMSNTVETLR